MEKMLWVALVALPAVVFVWFAALLAGSVAGVTS
jgi:hypothetical protein